MFIFLVKLFFLSQVEVGFIISFPKRSRRNSIPINTLYREVIVMCVFE